MTAEDPDDHTATTVLERVAPIWAWIRKHVSAGVAIAAVSAFAGSVAYVVHAQHSINDARRDATEAHDSVTVLQQNVDQLKNDVAQLRVDIATTQGEAVGVTREVDELRSWRDRLEQLAESPPHAAARRRR